MNPITAARLPQISAPRLNAAPPTGNGPAPQPTALDKFTASIKGVDYKMGAVNVGVGAACMAIASAAGASVAGQVALAIIPACAAFGVAEAIKMGKEGGKGGGDFASLGVALGAAIGGLKGIAEGAIKAPLIYGATVGLASLPVVASLGLPAAAIGAGVGLAIWGGTEMVKHLAKH